MAYVHSIFNLGIKDFSSKSLPQVPSIFKTTPSPFLWKYSSALTPYTLQNFITMIKFQGASHGIGMDIFKNLPN